LGLKLILSKGDLPDLKNFEIKYGSVGFELWNKFPYWNFSIFAMECE
jgi:hypothetical protein